MSDDKPKPIIKKLTKDNVYKKEQKKVVDKIIEILDIVPDDEKSTISKKDMENKYDDINELYDEIKIYYASRVTFNIDKASVRAMSIIRHILKHHGYKLDYKLKAHIENNKRTTMPYYFIISV